jgi:molybdopterin/thiamine biosynthesis adenylyltransferase
VTLGLDHIGGVTVIGCGGIGGHVLWNLCHFLHAERRAVHLTVVDGDVYEARNQSRMRFRPSATGSNKALVLASDLADAWGDVLTVEPVPEYVTPGNVAELVREGDVVFLTVDNHATRRLVDRRASELRTVALLSGGNDGVEAGREGTYGNVQVVLRSDGRALTSSLSRLHPEIREPADRIPGAASCTELAQSGAPQLLFTNLAVASAMLNAFYALVQGRLAYEEAYLDVVAGRLLPVSRAPEADGGDAG